jgi:lambda repressor-like predicted transcriptional regulator
VFGSIRKDKSIDTLLETLKYKFSKKIEIIIAGAIDKETKTLISTYLKDREKWVNELQDL